MRRCATSSSLSGVAGGCYLYDGDWVAAVLESSDRDAYMESLELIRELDFDVLLPWAASAGQPYHTVTSKAGAERRVDAILERVRRARTADAGAPGPGASPLGTIGGRR